MTGLSSATYEWAKSLKRAQVAVPSRAMAMTPFPSPKSPKSESTKRATPSRPIAIKLSSVLHSVFEEGLSSLVAGAVVSRSASSWQSTTAASSTHAGGGVEKLVAGVVGALEKPEVAEARRLKSTSTKSPSSVLASEGFLVIALPSATSAFTVTGSSSLAALDLKNIC